MERRSKDELLARLTDAKAEITAIDQQYEGHYIDPASEDGTKWNTLNAEVDELGKTVAQMTAREQRIAQLGADKQNTDEGFSFLTARPGAVTGQDIYDLSTVRASVANPAQMRAEIKDRAKRAIAGANFRHPQAETSKVQAHVERLLDTVDDEHGTFAKRLLVTGSPAYKRGFAQWLANGGHASPEFMATNMSLGTDAAGGFAVPFELDPTIILTSNGAVNPYRSMGCKTVQIQGKEWDGVTSAGVTASRALEAAEASDNSPTLAQPTVRTTRVQAFVPYSLELSLSYDALGSELAMLIADAKDVEEATAFTTGNGTAPNPQGLLTGATVSINTAATATFASVDIDALEQALPPRFQPNAQYIANRGIYNLIRHFDTAGGPDLWVRIAEQLKHGGNTGQTLHGYPANECSAFGSTHASGNTLMTIGDFSKFLIVDRLGLTLQYIPQLFGTANNYPTGQQGVYAVWMNSCKVLTPNAFVTLKAL